MPPCQGVRTRRGSPKFKAQIGDQIFLFASQAHKDMFLADPEHFTPVYGGLDASSLWTGKIVESDPREWEIVDDKLFLGRNGDFYRSLLAGETQATTNARLASTREEAQSALRSTNFLRAHAQPLTTACKSGQTASSCNQVTEMRIDF